MQDCRLECRVYTALLHFRFGFNFAIEIFNALHFTSKACFMYCISLSVCVHSMCKTCVYQMLICQFALNNEWVLVVDVCDSQRNQLEECQRLSSLSLPPFPTALTRAPWLAQTWLSRLTSSELSPLRNWSVQKSSVWFVNIVFVVAIY